MVSTQNTYKINEKKSFSEKMRNLLKRMQNQFSDFHFWDMVDFIQRVIN